MSEANQHNRTASLYPSPEEALKAPPEELLYVRGLLSAPATASAQPTHGRALPLRADLDGRS
jgi:hypothetical protein